MTSLKDEAITGGIIAALGASPKVNEMEIRVHTVNGRVLIQGIVDSLKEKMEAGRIARGISDVQSVENDLTVSANEEISDLEIQRCAQDLLDKAGLAGIGVRANAGTLFLMGVIPSLEVKERAIDVVANTEGARDVISELEIAAGEPVDDITLANDVAEALSDDPGMYTVDLEVRADNGCIHIEGEVPNEDQVELASTIAEAVPGVNCVQNRIKVNTMMRL